MNDSKSESILNSGIVSFPDSHNKASISGGGTLSSKISKPNDPDAGPKIMKKQTLKDIKSQAIRMGMENEDACLEMIKLEVVESENSADASVSISSQSEAQRSRRHQSPMKQNTGKISHKQSIDSRKSKLSIVKASIKQKLSQQVLPFFKLDPGGSQQPPPNEQKMVKIVSLKSKGSIKSRGADSGVERNPFGNRQFNPEKRRSRSSMSLQKFKFFGLNRMRGNQEYRAVVVAQNQKIQKQNTRMMELINELKNEPDKRIVISMESYGSISEGSRMNDHHRQHLVKEDTRSEFWKRAEKLRKLCTIKTSSQVYQIMKVLGIIASFITSFAYAYYAVFLHLCTESERAWFNNFNLIATIYFIIDLLFNTCVDEHNPQRDGFWTLKKSLERQIRGGRLIADLVAIFPFISLFEGVFEPSVLNLLYFIKVVRLMHGFSLLDYKTYKKQLIHVQKMRVQKLVENKAKKFNQTQDHAQMSRIVLFSILLKITRLIIIMSCLSYFTGLFFYVCSFFFMRLQHNSNFLDEYNFDRLYSNNVKRVSTLTYYAFTTLSTVGLGDFHPKNNSERIICAFIMLFGVTITSFLMENFSHMIQELKNFNKNYDESDRFTLFLGTMKKLNDDQPLPQQIVREMEKYFEYKWQFDKNLAISTEDDFRLFEQLPGRVQTQIYVTFLFKSFTDLYREVFDLNQNEYDLRRQYLLIKKLTRQNSMYQYDNAKIDNTKYYVRGLYDEFIVTFLRLLEPIHLMDQQVLMKEGHGLDKQDVIYFIMEGQLHIGYNHKKYVLEQQLQEIPMPLSKTDPKYADLKNRFVRGITSCVQDLIGDQKFRYPLKLPPGQVVGFYETIFQQTSQLHYKYRENREVHGLQNNGYFIRQRSWVMMQKQLEENEQSMQLINEFKNNILLNYAKKLYLKVYKSKEEWLQREKELVFQQFQPKEQKMTILKAIFKVPDEAIQQMQDKKKLAEAPAAASAVNKSSGEGHKTEQSKFDTQQISSSNEMVHAPHNREQAVSLIKTNQLSKLERIDKMLDRMVYLTEQQPVAVQKEVVSFNQYMIINELHLKLVQNLATDASEIAKNNINLHDTLHVTHTRLKKALGQLRQERIVARKQKKELKRAEADRNKLKRALKKVRNDTYKRIYKLETENSLLKDLFNSYQKSIVQQRQNKDPSKRVTQAMSDTKSEFLASSRSFDIFAAAKGKKSSRRGSQLRQRLEISSSKRDTPEPPIFRAIPDLQSPDLKQLIDRKRDKMARDRQAMDREEMKAQEVRRKLYSFQQNPIKGITRLKFIENQSKTFYSHIAGHDGSQNGSFTIKPVSLTPDRNGKPQQNQPLLKGEVSALSSCSSLTKTIGVGKDHVESLNAPLQPLATSKEHSPFHSQRVESSGSKQPMRLQPGQNLRSEMPDNAHRVTPATSVANDPLLQIEPKHEFLEPKKCRTGLINVFHPNEAMHIGVQSKEAPRRSSCPKQPDQMIPIVKEPPVSEARASSHSKRKDRTVVVKQQTKGNRKKSSKYIDRMSESKRSSKLNKESRRGSHLVSNRKPEILKDAKAIDDTTPKKSHRSALAGRDKDVSPKTDYLGEDEASHRLQFHHPKARQMPSKKSLLSNRGLLDNFPALMVSENQSQFDKYEHSQVSRENEKSVEMLPNKRRFKV